MIDQKPYQHIKSLDGVRNQVIDISSLMWGTVSVLLLFLLYIRSREIGWQNVILFHTVMTTAYWGLYILRNRLSLRIKSISFIGIIYAIGLAGYYNYGTLGAGFLLIFLCCTLTTVLFGQRSGLRLALVSFAYIFLIGFLISRKVLATHFDMEAMFFSSGHWLATTGLIGLVSLMLLLSIGKINNHMLELIRLLSSQKDALKLEIDERKRIERQLENYQNHLEELVEERTQELQAEVELREATERKVRTERDKARQYLDTVEALIIALDTNGDIMLVNRKGCEMLGYAEKALLGQNWFTTCLSQPEGLERIAPVFGDI